jgi:hypothetical protein
MSKKATLEIDGNPVTDVILQEDRRIIKAIDKVELTKAGNPKCPRPPVRPRKPSEPVEYFPSKESILDTFYDSEIEIPLSEILEKIPTGVPIEDVTVSARAESSDYDGCASLDFEIFYHTQVPNDKYKEQYAKYQKKLREHKEAMARWDEFNERYLVQKRAYDRWSSEKDLDKLDKDIKRLQAKRKKLAR